MVLPMEKRSVFQRILRIEPGISLGQWIYDTIAANWGRLAALFVAGGGMSYLSAITEWTAALGPAGIGAIGLGSALIANYLLALAQTQRAKSRTRDAETRAIEKWKEDVDRINPMDEEFHKKRIRLADLTHPVSGRIIGKKFINCQLIGPANIVFIGSGDVVNVGFGNCDLVLTKSDVRIYNVIPIEDCSIIRSEILNATVFVHPDLIEKFRQMPGLTFVNLTGDQEIDSRSQIGIEAEKLR